MVNINLQIDRLIKYALDKALIENEDVVFSRNRVMWLLGMDTYEVHNFDLIYENIEDILEDILNWAVENEIIGDTVTERELLDTNLMGVFVKRPSDIIKDFYNLYEESPVEATNYYYKFSEDTNYIRKERIKKDLKWITKTEFGDLDITINMSKPEKDPIEIEKALKMPQGDYPKCLLCRECEGYTGRLNYPSRGNHRIIPMNLNNSKWYMQYSPYVYFNEHSIILKDKHSPMSINRDSFVELLEFTDKFKHYFIGSNADLPIVGGSILTHDHYQSGNNVFALDNASVINTYNVSGFEDVEVSRIKWPLTAIRTRSQSRERLVDFADMLLTSWRKYSDESVGVLSYTTEPHNTVTPICRYKNGMFELDLVLRNNRKTQEHPFGLFHPHEELHHIKKENIGLIEVMGLAVLPSRLNSEIEVMKQYLISENENEIENLKSHEDWIKNIKLNRDINISNVDEIVKEEIGKVFLNVLEHCGVFKIDENGEKACNKFMSSLVGRV